MDHQKITINYCCSVTKKQTSQVNEFSTFLWEDASIWAHSNRSSDVRLSYEGQYPVLSHPESPQGTPLGWLQRPDDYHILGLLIRQAEFFTDRSEGHI